jgi:hypothetical protein
MRKEKVILPNMWSVEEGNNLLVTKVWDDKFRFAEVEVSEEKHFFFEAHGMQFRLSISEHGFTLWDNIEGQWILDALVFGYNPHISFGNNSVLKGVVLQPKMDQWGGFEIKPKVVIEAEVRPTQRALDASPAGQCEHSYQATECPHADCVSKRTGERK